MDAQFHDSPRLSKDTLKPLMERSNAPGLLRFLLQYSLFVGSAAWVVLNAHRSPWIWLPALLLFSTLVSALFAMGHETVHNTAFRSRWLNEFVLWLVSIPIYYLPNAFRHFHFEHHRYTHDPLKDPELSIGGKPNPSITSTWWAYLAFLSGLPLLLYKCSVVLFASIGHGSFLWDGILKFVPERARNRIRMEARLTLLFHIAYLTLALTYLPGLLLLLWGQWLGHSMLSFILISEHNGLPHTGSAIERTRTTLANPLIRFLMWNMPYHAEHHAYPAVPWHALPKLHVLLKEELLHISNDYPSFHNRVLQHISRGKAFVDEEIHTQNKKPGSDHDQ